MLAKDFIEYEHTSTSFYELKKIAAFLVKALFEYVIIKVQDAIWLYTYSSPHRGFTAGFE